MKKFIDHEGREADYMDVLGVDIETRWPTTYENPHWHEMAKEAIERTMVEYYRDLFGEEGVAWEVVLDALAARFTDVGYRGNFAPVHALSGCMNALAATVPRSTRM